MARFIRKYTIEEHNEIKFEIIKEIESIILKVPDAFYTTMTHSDYDIDYQGPYQKKIKTTLHPYLKHFAKSWSFRSFQIKNIWFASYSDGATFGWHSHEGCNMSGVYMLKLPEPSSATQFRYNLFDENIYEGDLVVFPSMVPHRSPVINNGEKIIIGFNWDMFSCE